MHHTPSPFRYDEPAGDSALSQIENPATLTSAPRERHILDFSTPVAFLPASWRGPLDTASSEIRAVPVGQAALTIPMDDRLTLGLALHTPSGLGARYDFRHLMIPWMPRRVGSNLDSLDLELNAAYKLTDRLSVGAGVVDQLAQIRFSPRPSHHVHATRRPGQQARDGDHRQ